MATLIENTDNLIDIYVILLHIKSHQKSENQMLDFYLSIIRTKLAAHGNINLADIENNLPEIK